MLDAVTFSALLNEGGLAKEAETNFTANSKVKDAFNGELRDLLGREAEFEDYEKLFKKASAPWITKLVDIHSHVLQPDGWSGDPRLWDIYLKNGMKAKQNFLITQTLTYGYSYVAVLPAEEGDVPVITVMSARNTYAPYSPWSSYPEYVLQKVDKEHWVYIDSEAFYFLKVTPNINTNDPKSANGIKSVDHVEELEHNLGFVPVVRVDEQPVDDKVNLPVAPFTGAITTAQSLTEARFHSLQVGRKASFPRLWATGVEDEGGTTNGQGPGDIFASTKEEAKFGAFPQADMSGVLAIKHSLEADLAVLTNTPVHMLASNGTIANLSAEALGSLNFAYMRQAEIRKTSIGEGLDELFRVLGYLENIPVDSAHTVHWDYVEPNNLGQIGDYSVKMHSIGAPLEGVFQMHPNVDQAKATEMSDYVETHQKATNASALIDLDIKRAQLTKIFVDAGFTKEEALNMADYRS